MNPNRQLLLVVTLIFAGVVTPLVARTWTDRMGRQVDAEFIEFKDGKVTVKRQADGKTFSIPLDSLSDSDQEFVRAQASTPKGDSNGKSIAVEQELWLSDLPRFLKKLEEEVRKSDPLAPFDRFEGMFKGKSIRWNLRFKGSKLAQQELNVEFEGVPTFLTFVSSDLAAARWGELKAGTEVCVEATVRTFLVVTLNPDGQGRGKKMGFVVFENTKLADETKQLIEPESRPAPGDGAVGPGTGPPTAVGALREPRTSELDLASGHSWSCLQANTARTGHASEIEVKAQPNVRWMSPGAFGTQVLVGPAGVYCIGGDMDQALALFDRDTGERKWEQFSANIVGSSCLDRSSLFSPMYSFGRSSWLSVSSSGIHALFAHDARSGEVAGKVFSNGDSLLVMNGLQMEGGRLAQSGPAVRNGSLFFLDASIRWDEPVKETDSRPEEVENVMTIKVEANRYDAVSLMGLTLGARKWKRSLSIQDTTSLTGFPPALGDKHVIFAAGSELCSLGLETGDLIWSSQVDGSCFTGPVLDGSRGYVVTSGGLTCFSASDGKQLWKCEKPAEVAAGRGCWPAVVGDVLVWAAGDGNLHGLRATSGDLVWSAPCKGPWSITASGHVAYAIDDDDQLNAFASRDGRVLWQLPLDRTPHRWGPTVVEGVIYVSTSRAVYALWEGPGHSLVPDRSVPTQSELVDSALPAPARNAGSPSSPSKAPVDDAKIVADLKSDDPETRNSAIGAAGAHGLKQAIPTLIELLTDEDEWIRKSVAEALGTIGDPRASEPLAKRVSDDKIGNYDKQAALQSLRKLDPTRADRSLLEALASPSPPVKSWAITAVGAAKLQAGVAPLIELLTDEDEWIRKSVAEALGTIGDPRATAPLAKRVSDDKIGNYDKQAALQSLRKLDPTRADRSLLEALTSSSPRVKSWAITAVGAAKLQAGVAPLIELLTDEDEWIRKSVAEALGTIGDPRATAPLAKRVSDDQIGGTEYDKHAAVQALRTLDPAQADRSLLEALTSSSPRVKSWAITAVGAAKLQAGVAPLIKLLTDEDEWIRKSVAEALGTIGDPRATEPLAKRVSDDQIGGNEYDKHAAVQALRTLDPARATVAIEQAIRSKNPNVREWATRERDKTN